MISNDMGVEHLNSLGTPFGIELHTLIYYYHDVHPALSRTIYVHQDIINRSANDYHDVYMGVWNDFDLGDPLDDYVRTNVKNAHVYVYNGTSFDGPTYSGPGYGYDLRSEEHTSELQSRPHLVCRLLLDNK